MKLVSFWNFVNKGVQMNCKVKILVLIEVVSLSKLAASNGIDDTNAADEDGQSIYMNSHNWTSRVKREDQNACKVAAFKTEKEFCQCKITSDEEALSKAGMSLGGSTYNSLIQCCADVVKTAKDNNCIKHDDQTGDDYVKCKDSLKQFENCTNKFDPGLFEKIMNPGAAFGDCAIIRCRGLIATIFICFLKMWLMN
ncbi:uncharacterized protein LOC142349562 [Convolutriloba macropyga]|uniref:uncharacterized protein LOC142349562 n=1 Tax=Convolutriloba macropyga TaxID=536237 RepID=UPI003F51E1D8